MLEITQEQWNLVLQKHQEKLDVIKDLVLDVQDKSEYIAELKEHKDTLASETSKLAHENVTLNIQNAKLQKELDTTNASLSLILETLDDAMNTIERHGLTSNKIRVQASELDILV